MRLSPFSNLKDDFGNVPSGWQFVDWESRSQRVTKSLDDYQVSSGNASANIERARDRRNRRRFSARNRQGHTVSWGFARGYGSADLQPARIWLAGSAGVPELTGLSFRGISIGVRGQVALLITVFPGAGLSSQHPCLTRLPMDGPA
jgi:hypothetical protein